MPAGTLHETLFLDVFGAPNLLNVASLYAPGQLGQRWEDTPGRVWQLVQADSGPTSIVAGDLAFWMSRANYKVTNKLTDAPEGRNGIAGIFTTTVTPGFFCFIQIEGASFVTVKTSGSPAIGDIAIANSGGSSDAAILTAGSALTYLQLGTFTSLAANNLSSVRLTIGASDTNP